MVYEIAFGMENLVSVHAVVVVMCFNFICAIADTIYVKYNGYGFECLFFSFFARLQFTY